MAEEITLQKLTNIVIDGFKRMDEGFGAADERFFGLESSIEKLAQMTRGGFFALMKDSERG